MDYLGETIDEREFVPTAELTGALEVEPGAFARDMAELECRPTRNYINAEDGSVRRVRGYLTADIRAAIERTVTDEIGSRDDGESEPS